MGILVIIGLLGLLQVEVLLVLLQLLAVDLAREGTGVAPHHPWESIVCLSISIYLCPSRSLSNATLHIPHPDLDGRGQLNDGLGLRVGGMHAR